MADKLGTFHTLEIVSYANPVLLLLYTYAAKSNFAFTMLMCSLMALWSADYALYHPSWPCCLGPRIWEPIVD
jgi:hypothetical protein